MPHGDDDQPKTNSGVTPRDIVDFVRGTANQDQIRPIRDALVDPRSALSSWLDAVAEHSEFPALVTLNNSGLPAGTMTLPEAKQYYHVIFDFIRYKRARGLLTSDDTLALVVAQTSDDYGIPQTVDQYLHAIERIMSAIATTHADIMPELTAYISTRTGTRLPHTRCPR